MNSWSWGWNKYGSVGNGSIEDVLRPVRIPITGVVPNAATASDGHKVAPAPQFIVSINVGYRHTMALSSSQLLFAWGMVNMTNATEAEAFAPVPAHTPFDPSSAGSSQSVQSSLPSSHITPTNGDSKRRFSVFCDASSTSELYLTPMQVLYSDRAQNPFSEGRFLALRGSSSSSLGYVTIDAEVPVTVTATPGVSATKALGVTGLGLRSGASVEASGSKMKLKTAATTVRAAMLFASPTRTTPNKADDLTVSDTSSIGKSPSIASPKPKFNPFLKDHSSKKEEQVKICSKFVCAQKFINMGLLVMFDVCIF